MNKCIVKQNLAAERFWAGGAIPVFSSPGQFRSPTGSKTPKTPKGGQRFFLDLRFIGIVNPVDFAPSAIEFVSLPV
jgi:hypothetical protein